MNKSDKFICTHEGCHKEYSTKFALRRHYITHSGVKPFSCKICSKAFSLEQYLTEHMNVHTKAKPFVCGINGCTETFRQRGKLCLHRMTHKEYQKKEYRVFARRPKTVKRPAKRPTQCPSTGPNSPVQTSKPTPPALTSAMQEPQPVMSANDYCWCELDVQRLAMEMQTRQHMVAGQQMASMIY